MSTPTTPISPKEDCESLLNAVMPLIEQLLSKYREFYPCGATMTAAGEIKLAMSSVGDDDHPPSEALISALESGFRQQAVEGTCRATALALDVLMVPPGKSQKQDAVEVRLDHRDKYSVRVLFPYDFSTAGELKLDPPVTVAGDGLIFR